MWLYKFPVFVIAIPQKEQNMILQSVILKTFKNKTPTIKRNLAKEKR